MTGESGDSEKLEKSQAKQIMTEVGGREIVAVRHSRHCERGLQDPRATYSMQ